MKFAVNMLKMDFQSKLFINNVINYQNQINKIFTFLITEQKCTLALIYYDQNLFTFTNSSKIYYSQTHKRSPTLSLSDTHTHNTQAHTHTHTMSFYSKQTQH